MFHLSQSGEYALRAMTFLAARAEQGPCSIAEIAKVEGVPEQFLRKVLQRLSRAGLIRSVRGCNGGVRLAQVAEAITVLAIIEAVEGPIVVNECVVRPAECERLETCAMNPIWTEANSVLVELLRSKTLASVAREHLARKASGGGRPADPQRAPNSIAQRENSKR